MPTFLIFSPQNLLAFSPFLFFPALEDLMRLLFASKQSHSMTWAPFMLTLQWHWIYSFRYKTDHPFYLLPNHLHHPRDKCTFSRQFFSFLPASSHPAVFLALWIKLYLAYKFGHTTCDVLYPFLSFSKLFLRFIHFVSWFVLYFHVRVIIHWIGIPHSVFLLSPIDGAL